MMDEFTGQPVQMGNWKPTENGGIHISALESVPIIGYVILDFKANPINGELVGNLELTKSSGEVLHHCAKLEAPRI
jgi:hypothetical protein